MAPLTPLITSLRVVVYNKVVFRIPRSRLLALQFPLPRPRTEAYYFPTLPVYSMLYRAAPQEIQCLDPLSPELPKNSARTCFEFVWALPLSRNLIPTDRTYYNLTYKYVPAAYFIVEL